MLIAVHGEGYGVPHGDDVQAELIAQLVPLGDRFQVIDCAVRAQGGQRLVFWPSIPKIDDKPLALKATPRLHWMAQA